ncbi:MAG: prepilin-type N-terminal cleavage/methylation domain-containing protein [Opitutaceae bacterium]|jgi:prepilin-type N-terminal cleavage/methylation domain-containing protein/prepilin-type processing-associated H-X9-DG protein|nr:prepilin-type N-terminal cleavage/methylation domain-containing protein [Opitutaceae bacterium]
MNPTYNSKQHAFTLVELLTVIAIIGILAGIIIPVVAKVRASARQVQSMSNVRQVAMAMILYAGDNKDHLPYGTWQGVNQILDPSESKMGPYLAKDNPAWWCPILVKHYNINIYTDPSRYWKGRIRTCGYITGENGPATYAKAGRPDPKTSNGMLLNSFARPSHSMLSANLDSSDRGGFNDGFANVAFADGSARKMRDDSYKTDLKVEPGVYWRYYTANEDGKRYGYDY